MSIITAQYITEDTGRPLLFRRAPYILRDAEIRIIRLELRVNLLVKALLRFLLVSAYTILSFMVLLALAAAARVAADLFLAMGVPQTATALLGWLSKAIVLSGSVLLVALLSVSIMALTNDMRARMSPVLMVYLGRRTDFFVAMGSTMRRVCQFMAVGLSVVLFDFLTSYLQSSDLEISTVPAMRVGEYAVLTYDVIWFIRPLTVDTVAAIRRSVAGGVFSKILIALGLVVLVYMICTGLQPALNALARWAMSGGVTSHRAMACTAAGAACPASAEEGLTS